jgi:selenide,water dikinase
VLGDIPRVNDDRVLVEFRTGDDAGVYRWEGGPALVQTVDFFTPVVDDPYVYGQIAAANALSDVYAMGGVPRTALAIAALPKDGPGPEIVKAIFRGGYDKLEEAETVLLGGHTVTDQEIKFGYAVTGEIQPDRIFTNARARVGDQLLLTKPLGTGIIATALKFNRASERQVDGAIESMVRLNRDAAGILRALPAGIVSACTDVTGFGLAGHGSAMAAASGVALVFESASLPVLEGALGLAAANTPGGGKTNQSHFGQRVVMGESVIDAMRLVIFDPQTSGGLLVAVDSSATAYVMGRLHDAGVPAMVIGRVEARTAADGALVFVD